MTSDDKFGFMTASQYGVLICLLITDADILKTTLKRLP